MKVQRGSVNISSSRAGINVVIGMNMIRPLSAGLLGLALTGCATRTVYVRSNAPVVQEEIVQAPPPEPAIQTEVIYERPSPAHVWIAGYWGWRGGRYLWTPGYWCYPPRPHSVWVRPHWERHPQRGYIHIEGHWR
jgi:hypothetical protein